MTTDDGQSDSAGERISVYDAVGGSPFFFGMVNSFYDSVVSDPILRPLYPDDLTEARRHTALFLVQFWGGPTTYNEERGHPRLRMRHFPFAIGQAERDAWLEAMMTAVDATIDDPPAGSPLSHPSEGPAIQVAVREMFRDYFEKSSTAMINQPSA